MCVEATISSKTKDGTQLIIPPQDYSEIASNKITRKSFSIGHQPALFLRKRKSLHFDALIESLIQA
jgi:hypothetical protein